MPNHRYRCCFQVRSDEQRLAVLGRWKARQLGRWKARDSFLTGLVSVRLEFVETLPAILDPSETRYKAIMCTRF
jgi:hypothetical protein